jgi:hypothetical protein
MSIELYGRGDRLGANITTMIAQIICAVDNKYYIHYDRDFINTNDDVNFVPYNQNYSKSVFIESLFDYIDVHNKECNKYAERLRIDTIHFFTMISSVLLKVKLDLISYFKMYIYEKIYVFFINNSLRKNYFNNMINLFDPLKSILVHLRLDDVRNSPDYDGRVCANHFRNVINNDIIADNNTDRMIKQKTLCNVQSPLALYKINEQINKAKMKYPDHKVIIITNPGENTSKLPYECIQSSDESQDLFFLCNANVVILSRSTYSVSSLFFSKAQEVYLPLWGHLPCFGIYSKYDNCNFNYYY